MLHETGHALYEQDLPAEHFGTPLGVACSFGIHESQSRLWENQVGRGRPFWDHFFPRLRQAFPGTLADVSPDAFYFAINDVRPSLIRVEADEATYNLHIALRFRAGTGLAVGRPDSCRTSGAWNERFEALFGLTCPTMRAAACRTSTGVSGASATSRPTRLATCTRPSSWRPRSGDLGADSLTQRLPPRRLRSTQGLAGQEHPPAWPALSGRRTVPAGHRDFLSPQPFRRYLSEKFSRVYGVC